MPIALLFAPLLATAAATTTTTSTAVVVGAVAAGAGGTAAAGTGIWYFFFRGKESESPPKAHQDSVKRQNQKTRRRIHNAEEAVTLLRQGVRDGIDEVRAALVSEEESKVGLRQSVNSIVGINQQLVAATRDVVSSTVAMSHLLPVVQEMAEKTDADSVALVAKLGTLNQQLDAREGEIKQARTDIENLNGLVGTQGRAVEQLTGVVRTLTVENEDLRSSLTSQKHKYERLEVAAKHADHNHRLFKRAVQESVIPPADRVSTQTVSTQTSFK